MKFKVYTKLFCVALAAIQMSSCQSYLERTPDADVSSDAAFKNFFNFQGFIEQMYNAVPNKIAGNYNSTFNFGEDELANFSDITEAQFMTNVDQGNFWAWQANISGSNNVWYDKINDNPGSGDNDPHGLWSGAWYCIRKANLGIANIDKLVDATQEEHDLILGQLYFFRAWWHFEMGVVFGGLPYIDTVLPADIPQLPRLSFREYADKAAADFQRAAELLPIDWDETQAGVATFGYNSLRVNKIAALGYLGKTYLWNASPLIEVGAETGGANTYTYNKEYAEKAAKAFGEIITLVENGQTQYSLAQFNYSKIYDHVKAADATSCYSDIFYTVWDHFKTPGSVETIFQGLSSDGHNTLWNHGYHWGPKVNSLVAHDVFVHQPTANYVEYYGMANGLPLTDPNSGYDPEHPFKDRDPRFYHDIMFDGFKFVSGSISSDDDKFLQYLNMSTGGWTRDENRASRTGYLTQKLAPHQINKFDKYDSWDAKYHGILPYMRLADIYLMYAEACAAVGGANQSFVSVKTAAAAINTLRERVGAGEVGAEYLADNEKFMDEIRRERAVELAFEAQRFDDLRRWLLLTEAPYTTKTAHEFDRVENDDFYKKNDPKDAKVKNLRSKTLVTRHFTAKHYWLPLKKRDVQLYEGFEQNPGW